MHEMSIALSIVDLAAEQAKKANAKQVVEIELDIGALSGIEVEALNFALEIAVKDTVLEKSRVKINRIGAVSECLQCDHIFDSDDYVHICPQCGESNTRIIKGREMQVKSLLIE